MIKVLLLGAGGNAGINFTKSVHKGTVMVYGMDMNNYYAKTSNADATIAYPAEGTDKAMYIREIIKTHKIDFVHAQPDPEVKFLLNNNIPKIFPHKMDMWQKFADKSYCQQIWSENLHQFEVHNYAEFAFNPNLFLYMKEKGGGKVWVRATQGAGSRAALPVETLQQADNWINYWVEMKKFSPSDFMLCQYLPGKEYAVQTFWYNGNLIHSQARQRLIYFFGALMPSGQTSTPAVACTVSDKLVYDTAYEAIKLIDPHPHGIYCVDIKEDMEENPIPTEVNYGRFFTTCDFFAEIGINTPLEYVRSMTEYDYEPHTRIETIRKRYYWIRGLDKTPGLLTEEQLSNC